MLNNGKRWYMSKTLIFNILALIVAIAAGFGYKGELPAEWAVFVPAIIAIINLILRFATDRPIRK